MVDKKLERIYAISGSESLLIREALHELKTRAGADEADGFDYLELDGANTTAAEIVAAASTIPFLAQRRTVPVFRPNKLSETDVEALISALPKIPETALLIMYFEPTNDRSVSAAEKKLIAAAKKNGAALDCKTPSGDFLKILQKRAAEWDSKLQSDAAAALREMTSESLTDAVAELEKCSLFVGRGGTITADVVRKIASPSREWQVFKMMDHICAGKTGLAHRELNSLLGSGSNTVEVALRNLFPMLQRQLRLLWQAKGCAAERLAPGAAPHITTKQYGLASASDYARSRARDAASKLSFSQIAAMMRVLTEADMRLKGLLPSAFAVETLERLVVEMTGIAAGLEPVLK